MPQKSSDKKSVAYKTQKRAYTHTHMYMNSSEVKQPKPNETKRNK